MSTIKATKRLVLEDFPAENRTWLEKLVSPLNDFITQTFKILNGGIIFTDNVLGKDHLFDFTYQSDALSFPIGFLWTFGFPPRALSVVSASQDGVPVIVAVSWQLTIDNQVQIVSAVRFTSAPAVALLNATSRYKIRVRVTP